MKKNIASFIITILLSGSLTAQPAQSPASTPTVTTPAENSNAGDFKFVEETWDFGKIPQNANAVPGKYVNHTFVFTNTGKEPIVISDCHASCGCTTPDWPKEPILPGKTAKIAVKYNAVHAGVFNKSITITSNAKTTSKIIFIKGEVEAAPVEQTTPEKQSNIVQPSGAVSPK